MSVQLLLVLLKALTAVLAGMLVFIISTKVLRSRKDKIQHIHSQVIKSDLRNLLVNKGADYDELCRRYVGNARKRMKDRQYQTALETTLLEYLEDPDQKHRKRIISISYELGFPPLCLQQIRSRSNRIVAFGCRKAGLYRYEEAIPNMLAAFSIFSGETQFQILMGLSRIGNVNAMKLAFDSIGHHVMINQRAAFEILAAFTGNKPELYKRMLHYGDNYIVALFLKSLDRDTAIALTEDIVDNLDSGDMETRISAIKAIGITEDNDLAHHLIRALNDGNWEVRAIAAKMLGTLVDPGAGAVLSLALHDREWWVRQNAARSLLSYPDCEELYLAVIRTGDAYAIDSILHTVEGSERQDMLAKIQAVLAETDAKEDSAGLNYSAAGEPVFAGVNANNMIGRVS